MPKNKKSKPADPAQSLLSQIMGKTVGKVLEGHLPTALDCAVPLWILRIKDRSPDRSGKPTDEDHQFMKELDASDFCLRLQYVLFKGPKSGDTAKAFNELARCVSIMAFLPGGVTIFGRRWEVK